jgi:6-phosphogluconolactonase
VARPLTPPVGELELTEDVPGAFVDHVHRSYAGRRGPRFTLVLSGGPTAQHCYERLAARPGPIDWSLVDVFMGDERCVDPDDPDANQHMVRRTLLAPVGGVGSFHPMSCAEGAASYEHQVRAQPPPDLLHLGLGPDGHTASLFPDSPALSAPPGLLVTDSEDPHGRNRHRRMTLTLAGIGRARLVLFTVASEEKREAFARLCAGEDLPASRVRAGRVVWLVDPPAAGIAAL